MNTHSFTGKIGKDLERKVTTTGKTVCKFTVAVSGKRKNDKGEYPTYWFNCEVWEKTAEYLLNYGFKGAEVAIVSEPVIEEYKDKDGQDKRAYKEMVNEINVLSRKPEAKQGDTSQKPKVQMPNGVKDVHSMEDDFDDKPLLDIDQSW
jgi:single-strand DNA-binding protein